jgi:hypothetical protein
MTRLPPDPVFFTMASSDPHGKRVAVEQAAARLFDRPNFG